MGGRWWPWGGVCMPQPLASSQSEGRLPGLLIVKSGVRRTSSKGRCKPAHLCSGRGVKSGVSSRHSRSRASWVCIMRFWFTLQAHHKGCPARAWHDIIRKVVSETRHSSKPQRAARARQAGPPGEQPLQRPQHEQRLAAQAQDDETEAMELSLGCRRATAGAGSCIQMAGDAANTCYARMSALCYGHPFPLLTHPHAHTPTTTASSRQLA